MKLFLCSSMTPSDAKCGRELEPADPTNKVTILRGLHRQQVTPWWNHLQKDLGG